MKNILRSSEQLSVAVSLCKNTSWSHRYVGNKKNGWSRTGEKEQENRKVNTLKE